MRRMDRLTRYLSLLLLAVIPLGCQPATPPPAPAPAPTAHPAPAPKSSQRFENQPTGIAFSYPGGWKPSTATAVRFEFVRPDTDPSKLNFTLDVPNLPIHFGILPLDKVCSGYVDDAKKTMPDAQLTSAPDPTVPDAKEKRFKLTGHKDGAAHIDEAAILIHADKVYILAINCDEKSYPLAKAALDQAVQSVQWLK
jgi:hypothetical protein